MHGTITSVEAGGQPSSGTAAGGTNRQKCWETGDYRVPHEPRRSLIRGLRFAAGLLVATVLAGAGADIARAQAPPPLTPPPIPPGVLAPLTPPAQRVLPREQPEIVPPAPPPGPAGPPPSGPPVRVDRIRIEGVTIYDTA